MKNYVCGRSNLALTVQVPYDCPNTCPFCTAKEKYQKEKPNYARVARAMYDTLYENDLPIVDVVFSGGEPSANIGKLASLINIVPESKNVYINTTLLAPTFEEFYTLVKSEKKIKGVNISRHSATYEEDCKLFHNIATDEQIEKLASITSVRINVVLYKDVDIEAIVNRWENHKVNSVSFREDFRKVKTERDLREPNDFTDKLRSLYNGWYSGGCNVCNTEVHKKGNLDIRYHRGFESTLLDRGNYYEYNDIVIEPNGEILLDWEYSIENQNHYNSMISSNQRNNQPIYEPSYTYGGYCGINPCGIRPSSYCGRSSCGGSHC